MSKEILKRVVLGALAVGGTVASASAIESHGAEIGQRIGIFAPKPADLGGPQLATDPKAAEKMEPKANPSVQQEITQADVDATVAKAVATAFASRGFPDQVRLENAVEKAGIRFSGVPDRVDPNNVDAAKDGFKNTIGVGTHIIAEPGVLHVGPDHFVRKDGLEAFDKSEGGLQPFNPLNQEGVRWYGGAEQRLPEGGFVFLSGGNMTFKVKNAVFELPHKEGHNYFVYIRGRFGDQKQNTDRNLNVQLLPGSYRVGNLQIREYNARNTTNAGFVSEGQFLQEVGTSHSGGGNTGDGGASDLTIMFYDVNTGALEIASHSQGRFEDAKKASFKSLYSNFLPVPTGK